MISDSDLHPLDFAALERGDHISKDQLLKIFGMPEPNSLDSVKHFALQRLSLQDSIHRERPELRCKIERDGLRVCTSEQAALHGKKRFDEYFGGLRRESRRLARTVDVSELTADAAREHEHNVKHASVVTLAAYHASMRELRDRRLANAVSNRPELPAGGSVAKDSG